jgi:predicted nucleic acid-binding protein
MAKPVVCNAGPLIHLDQLGSLDLFSDFPSISVPETVWAEVTHHRPAALPQPFLAKVGPAAAVAPGVAALCRAFSLDAGEAACLALLSGMPEAIFLTDDAAARLVAGNMGLWGMGSLNHLQPDLQAFSAMAFFTTRVNRLRSPGPGPADGAAEHAGTPDCGDNQSREHEPVAFVREIAAEDVADGLTGRGFHVVAIDPEGDAGQQNHDAASQKTHPHGCLLLIA